MNSLGEWYVKQNSSYMSWHCKQQRDIFFYHVKVYGIPALIMIGLGISHYFVKPTSVLCFSILSQITN